MLKSNYIQLVQSGVGTQFGERTISIHLGLVFEQLLGQLYTADPSQLDFFTKEFPPVEVQKSGKYSYAILPSRIIHFKDQKKGVRSISTTLGTSVQFVPVTLLGRKIYGKIIPEDTSIGFEVKTDRVIFENMPEEIKEVVFTLVIPFDAWLMTDDIPAPSGVNETIIQMAISSLKGEGVPVNIHKTAK